MSTTHPGGDAADPPDKTYPETSPSSCLLEKENHRVFTAIMAKKTAQIHAPSTAVVRVSSWDRRKQEGVKLQGIPPRKRFLSPLPKLPDRRWGELGKFGSDI